MRLALVIIVGTLTLGLSIRLMPAEVHGATPDLESIHMIDALTGWAVTNGSDGYALLLRTTDGGTHWRDVTPPSSSGRKISVWKIRVLSSLITWVMPAGRNGTTAEIFRTSDGGSTWSSATIPAPPGYSGAPVVTSISFINPSEGWLIAFLAAATGRQAVEIDRSTDGGETWSKVAASEEGSGLPLYGGKDSITFLNPTTGLITVSTIQSDQPVLYVTHDGGHIWRQQNLPLPQQQQNLPLPPQVTQRRDADPWPPKFFTAQDGILRVDYHHYLFNESTGDTQDTRSVVVFHVTHDGGATWTYTTPVPVRLFGDHPHQPSSFADMNYGWVKEGDVLYVTSDGGRRWTKIRPNQLFADVTQLDFISPQVGWAIRKTFPFLLETLDGGRGWTPVTYTILRQ